MNKFVFNKIVSLGITSFIFLTIYLLFYNSYQVLWRFWMFAFIVIGNWHIIGALIYKVRRKVESRKFEIENKLFISTFVILTIGAVYFRYIQELITFAAVFLAFYFYFHTIINEKVLYEKSFNKKTTYNPYLYLLFVTFAMIVHSLETKSLYIFIADKGYYTIGEFFMNNPTLNLVSPLNIPFKEFIVLALLVISVFFLYRVFDESKKAFWYFSALLLLVIIYILFLTPIQALLIIAFGSVYHPLTWFVFYMQDHKFIDKQNQRRVLIESIALISVMGIVFILGNLITHPFMNQLYYYFFSIQFNFFLSFVHITISLDNDTFSRRLFGIK